MGISYKNLNKVTPKIPRVIGNMLIMFALGIQPVIVGADKEIMSDKAKFYASLILTTIGVAGKGFTMMFAEEDIKSE